MYSLVFDPRCPLEHFPPPGFCQVFAPISPCWRGLPLPKWVKLDPPFPAPHCLILQGSGLSLPCYLPILSLERELQEKGTCHSLTLCVPRVVAPQAAVTVGHRGSCCTRQGQSPDLNTWTVIAPPLVGLNE